MSQPTPPFAVQPGEGTAVRTPTGDSALIKAARDQTDGSMSVLELVLGPGQGPALHRHRHEDELWFVLDGEFRFKAGDQLFRASTGGMAFGPRGTAHCFQNVGDAAGRLLIVTTPGGLERLFLDFAADPRPELLVEIGLANGIEFIGPPLAVSDPT